MENTIVSKNIDLQERKDAYVVERILDRMFNGKANLKEVVYTEMPKYTHYDLDVELIGENKTLKLAFEIKERNKSEYQLKTYPNSELKADKLKFIMNSTKDYDYVYYIQLINEDFAYLYNLRTLDWSKVETREWSIKTTQYNPNSGYKSTLTHFIPYSLGKKVENLAEIYADYYYNNPEDKRYANTK